MTDQAPARPLLIHVGYHKTATTWLQNRVFRPEHGFHVLLSHDDVFTTTILPHGLDFDPAPVAARMARAKAGPPAGAAVDVVSLEALSGLPYDGGRESDAYALRLKAIAPDARILLTIREQTAIMASVYMQYLYRAGTESPRRFFDEAPVRGFQKFTAQNFCYHRLVGLYQTLFGVENVLVLPQEMIARDQEAAVALLAAFSGNAPLAGMTWTPKRERGVSYPQFAAPLLRRINYFRCEAMNPNPMIDLGRLGHMAYSGTGWALRRMPLPEGLRKSRPVTAYIRDRFAGRFADSNRQLASMLHYPVELTGYQGIDAP